MGKIIQKIIKIMPLVLFFMLIFVDREDKIQVFGFLFFIVHLYYYSGEQNFIR